MKKSLSISIVLASLILLSGCAKKIDVSDNLTFSYTWYYSDWSVFETWTKDIVIGSGEIPKFMEDALVKKDKSDKNLEISVSPEDAYWALYDKTRLQKIPKFIFDKIFDSFTTWETKQFKDIEWVVKWLEVNQGSTYVLFDLNPRQTWDDLKYEIRILDRK